MRRLVAAPRAAWAWVNASLARQMGATLVVGLVLVAAVVVVTSRGADEGAATDPPTPTTGAVAPTTEPEPTLPPPPEDGLPFLPEDEPAEGGTRAPLTGLRVPDGLRLVRPAVAVKIDNLDVPGETARPQVGLAHADVVVEQLVEGGITRFVAVLHSTDAPEVGPVRSARTTDVGLLPAFGAPLFAFSGGNPAVLGAVAAAPRIVDRGGEWAPAYVRVDGRRAPHNLFVRPWEIWASSGDGAPPPELAPFRPQAEPLPIGEPVQGAHLDLRGPAAATVTWTWLPEHRRWVRHQGGTLHLDGDGWVVGPRNVVVMVAEHRASPADPRSPEAVSVGSGEAWVLSDGKAVIGTWERPTEDAPLALLGPDGAPLALAAGRTWIELVPAGVASLVR